MVAKNMGDVNVPVYPVASSLLLVDEYSEYMKQGQQKNARTVVQTPSVTPPKGGYGYSPSFQNPL
jgi:hypothetical protein